MNNIIHPFRKNILIAMHIIAWLVIFLVPILFFVRSDENLWTNYLKYIITPISFLIIFYLNYCVLIGKFLFANRLKRYIAHNAVLIIFLCGFNYLWLYHLTPYIPPRSFVLMEKIEELEKEVDSLKQQNADPITIINQDEVVVTKPNITKTKQRDRMRFRWWHIVTDIFSFVCIAGIAAAIKTTSRWFQTEEKRQEEEKQKVEAELKNLKSQINPHFLFNTLNNIYALIAISPEKSQEAVMELSKMLRYVLYDDGQQFVPIQKEIDFINNYVDLMRLRLTKSVEVEVTTDISKNPSMPIAPLLFISLIENAFKHGVTNNQPSFIHFSIVLRDEYTVRCELKNSYFPKSEEHDKSGSGIGMENTRRRLELIYPNSHIFEYGVDGDTYHSLLIINANKEKKNDTQLHRC